MEAATIINAVNHVTNKWAKQRKAEERQANSASRRRQVMTRSCRYTIKDAVFGHISDAYHNVSDGGQLPAHARQLMYDVRRRIQADTDEPLNDSYFTQTLLPQYMREHRRETSDWDVVFDARGTFVEPHTGRSVPLGTLEVRKYLTRHAAEDVIDCDPGVLYPTHGPACRFGAILFVEKEGFWPLFKKVKLAERFDIAIMSTKGLSNTASRKLVDRLCGEYNIPLFVLHDLDKAGFSIFGTLSRNTDRFSFKNQILTVDLGLRLEDVQRWGLGAETYYTKAKTASIRGNLRRNGATPEEIEFIADQRRRVELNAFTSRDMILFVEEKLVEQGVKKVVPDAATLEDAYRRALKIEFINSRLDDLKDEADKFVEATKVPSLQRTIAGTVKDDPALPWDKAVARLAAQKFEETGP